MALEALTVESTGRSAGHPWVDEKQFTQLPESGLDGQSIALVDVRGAFLGCGVFDRTDPVAAWRRYTLAEDVAFDDAYLASALVEAIERRGEEGCQRLVNSDADYLPGLIVDHFNGVVRVICQTRAVRAHVELIVEVLREGLNPVEMVIDQGGELRTASGQGLKGRWIEMDGHSYRIDLLDAEKAGFFLDQREQHALVGSLCAGRTVLDAFSHSGAFAIQAMSAGAARAVAVDSNASYVKAIGANAQRNECPVETVAADAAAYLSGSEAGTFDGIIFDPPFSMFADYEALAVLHRVGFAHLPQGGLMATYCRSTEMQMDAFEGLVAAAAAQSGREARIFARTSQPFDFPLRLNFPESCSLKGLILQVE
ncbi:MAG: class I SAM-dependent rRNA methyltransferase [Opitutales bacterium]